MKCSGDIPYRVSASGTEIYYISYRSSSRGLTLKVTTLDPITGSKIGQHTLSSENDVYSEDDIVFVGSNSATQILAWSDASCHTLKVNVLGTSHVSTFDTYRAGAATRRITIHASGRLDSQPHFLAHYANAEAHWAEVYHVDLKSQTVLKAYELPKLQGQGAFAETTVDANVYFTRITDDTMILISSASHGVLEKWPISGLSSSTAGRTYPLHAASEVVVRGGTGYAIRATVLLSNGEWVLLRNGEAAWTRLEVLAGALKAVFAPPRTEPALVEELEAEAVKDPVSAYFHRVFRHIFDAQALPSWLTGVPGAIMKSVFSTGSLTASITNHVDPFGFNKLIVVATKTGRLIGLESGNKGRVAWNIRGVPAASLAALDASASLKKALGYFESIDRSEVFGSLLDLDSTSLQALEAHIQSLATIDETEVPIAKSHAVMTYKHDGTSVKGYRGLDLTWEFNLRPSELVLRIERSQENEPVASIGKVLGDRRVLYKYLNPNAILILATDETNKQLVVYLLDAVSGTLLHSTAHKNVAVHNEIAAVVSENWFAYSFATDSSSDDASKGYHLAIGELLESSLPDDRGSLAIAINSSMIVPESLASLPHVLMQTYLLPYPVTSMSVTQTAQGITSRELLLNIAEMNAIVGVPRMALDPRRIIGKAPTASQMEEGLSQYSPMIDFNPQWFLNHKEEVVGITDIITSPSSLESTSLVFAYGLDIFGTRRTPSFAFDILGNSFNKFTLILTVVVMTIGTIAIAPFIERKQTNMIWQNSS
jgi:hypothetical protein